MTSMTDTYEDGYSAGWRAHEDAGEVRKFPRRWVWFLFGMVVGAMLANEANAKIRAPLASAHLRSSVDRMEHDIDQAKTTGGYSTLVQGTSIAIADGGAGTRATVFVALRDTAIVELVVGLSLRCGKTRPPKKTRLSGADA